MTEEQLKSTVIGLLKNIAPDTEPEKLKPNDNIRQVLGIDSFDYLQFIVKLDKHFGIETPEEDYGKITTLFDLIPYIMDQVTKTK